jgi:hypothetical protein
MLMTHRLLAPQLPKPLSAMKREIAYPKSADAD